MNKGVISLLGGLALLAGGGWLWSRDEPLDPQAQAWREQVAEVGEASEA